MPYSAMLVFSFGWRSGPVTYFSPLLFRAFLKTYKKDWMSTWRRNACFSRGIVSSFIFFQNTQILVFSRSLPWFFLHCFYTFLVYPCIATLGTFIYHPTEFWIIEPLVFQIFLVFCGYLVDDSWLLTLLLRPSQRDGTRPLCWERFIILFGRFTSKHSQYCENSVSLRSAISFQLFEKGLRFWFFLPVL